MKKIRIIILFMSLFLGMFFFIPIRVSAYTYNPDDVLGLDFTSYKDEIVFCGIDLEAGLNDGPWFYAPRNPIHWKGDPNVYVYVYIKEIELNKFFQFNINTDFSPLLESEIRGRYSGSYYYTGSFIKTEYGRDGMYWNPWLQIWQLGYPIDPEVIMTAENWFNHISLFDFGFAYGEINDNGDITILEEPSQEFDGWFIDYDFNNGDTQYFEPELDILEQLYQDEENIYLYLQENFEDFDGYLYWNFEQGYWQVEYYEFSELDYYKQKVDGLEDEIQQLEDDLDLEYDRGYNDGYEIGYNEGLLVENNDIDIIKWFVPLVVIIIVVGVFESIKIFKRRDE